MFRNVINDLAAWYEEPKHKILCIKGAYGVGKTWTIKDFATAFFSSQKYIDCSENKAFHDAISGVTENDAGETELKTIESRIEDIDSMLEQHFECKDFADSILIFDEVQDISDCGELFYKYARKHRDYTICLIASTMEINEFEYTHPDVFKIIRMRPMNFEEYMIANKAHPFMAAIANHKSTPLTSLEENAISSMLKEYMMVGGMPGIVSAYLKNRDYTIVRPMQEELLGEYEANIKQNFSSAMSQRCRRIWKSIPKQLTHDNKKFMYRFVETNARGREYSEATQLLCDMGIVRKLPRLTDGSMPLEENVDYKAFELFYIDHGLLRAAYGLPINEELTLKTIFEEQNGAIAEQFIFQELSNKVGNLYYWTSGATARVPFVYEGASVPVPVDIRFTPNPKAQNIKTFRQKNPDTDTSLRVSLEPISLDNKVLNVPAYSLWNM